MTDATLNELIEFLAATPDLVREITSAFSYEEAKWKPSDDEFSALEQVCHLRDIEREVYGVRINRILTEEMPVLPDLDGARLARERNYNSEKLETALDEFKHARRDNMAILRELTPGEMRLRGVMEGAGEITLGGLLNLMHQHDQSHRDELDELNRRLRTVASNASTSDTSTL